jgi:hypothetical protein
LYLRYPPRRIQTFWLTYLPGIDLTKQALAQGVLTESDIDDIERGSSRVFRHAHLGARAEDAENFARLKRYDVLFRLFPLLPRWARERLRAEHIPNLSDRAASALGFAADLANATLRADAETFVFARHYAWQAWRQLPDVLLRGRRRRRRTSPYTRRQPRAAAVPPTSRPAAPRPPRRSLRVIDPAVAAR